jgi:hypothetical protein
MVARVFFVLIAGVFWTCAHSPRGTRVYKVLALRHECGLSYSGQYSCARAIQNVSSLKKGSATSAT